MGRRTHSPVRERKDYTRLLSELQGRTPSSPAEVAVAAPEEEKEPYLPRRQRIMSEKIEKTLEISGFMRTGLLHLKCWAQPNGANLNRYTVYFYNGLLVAVIFAEMKKAGG